MKTWLKFDIQDTENGWGFIPENVSATWFRPGRYCLTAEEPESAMNPNEYSEEVRELVRVVGQGCHKTIDAYAYGHAVGVGLIARPVTFGAQPTLSDKGRELLQAMKNADATIEFDGKVWPNGEGGVFAVAAGKHVRYGATYHPSLAPTEREPEPVAPPSWDDAPEWAEWIAQDSNGWWWAYKNNPAPLGGVFGGTIAPVKRLCVGIPNPNWRDTLQQRPEPEPLCPVCGKPASEHNDGLFCCGHCSGRVMMSTNRLIDPTHYVVKCLHCGATVPENTSRQGVKRVWNRRA